MSEYIVLYTISRQLKVLYLNEIQVLSMINIKEG